MDEQIPQTSFVATLLFAFEAYHAISHFCVLFRVRLLPKQDLVRLRYYFLIDLLTVASSAIYTRETLWLAAIQNMQHLYFYVTWNKAKYCIKVINWSSLDWFSKPGDAASTLEKGPEMDVSLGTGFDMMVHVVYCYHLSQYLHTGQFLLAAILNVVLVRYVLFNGKLAWSNPQSMPGWVSKRVKHLPNKYQ